MQTAIGSQPHIAKRDYDKLVEKGVRLLRSNGGDTLDTERRLRIKAFHLITRHFPDRRQHASELAMQAAFDAAAQLGIPIE